MIWEELSNEDLLLFSILDGNMELAKIAIERGARNIKRCWEEIEDYDYDTISFCKDVQDILHELDEKPTDVCDSVDDFY